MVIKSKIYDFLKKNLGEYLYGFQKNQLDVGLLSGHIDLVNVNFRPDKVNQLLGSLGLPITIKAGLLGKLRLKCHYTSFLSSPIEVEIDELLLVFGPITHLARDEKTLFEDETDEGLWQVEMEQKVIASQKTRNRAFESRDETPNLYSDGTPRAQNSRIASTSFKSEEPRNCNLSSQIASEEEGARQKKKRKHRHEKREDENICTTKVKTDLEFSARAKHIVLEERNIPSGQGRERQGEVHTHRARRENFVIVPEKPKKEGFLEKYFSKVLKNLILTIKSVHIRYEDETYPFQNPFSIGISLAKLEVKNVSQEWVYKDGRNIKRNPRKNAIVKEVTFSNFAMYIYSMASVLIPTSLWEATIQSEIGIFEAFPAYEVRDLIIQESQTLSSNHSSTFIAPTNASLCISFYEEAPTLRIAGFVDKVAARFTASMAECVRNFFDYVTNVQIWPLVLRFRPYARIPERSEKKERHKARKKRREIIRLWFQYAFAFVKTKRAAIKYVKERKKDNELFKKMEKQEKIREKVLRATHKDNLKHLPSTSISSTEASKTSIFSSSKQRKTPGTSGLKLDEIVKDYNSKKSSPNSQLKRRPYDGDLYFPKSIQNSEIELNICSFSLSIADEDTNVSIEIECFDLGLITNTLLDEMKTLMSIGGFTAGISDGHDKKCEILRAGRKKSFYDVKSSDPIAVKISKTYRPGEVFVPNDMYLSLNMYEVLTQFSSLTVTYTHNALNHFFLVKEAIELDKCFRENLDLRYVKAFKKHCKRHSLPKVFGVDFKKFVLCKQVAQKFVDMQKEMDVYVHEVHGNIAHILFDIQVELDGGVVNFNDFSQNAMVNVTIPKGKIQLGKDKDSTYANALGLSLKTSSAPLAVYEFISTIFGIFTEKVKQIDTFYSYKNPSYR